MKSVVNVGPGGPNADRAMCPRSGPYSESLVIPETEQQSRLPTVEIAHNARKRRFAGLEADRERDFPCLIRRNELLDQQEPEIHRRTGAPRGEDIPVNDHAFLGQDVRQLAGYGEMGGVAAAVEQSCGVKDGGRGADCRDPFAGRGMSPDRGGDPRIGAEILDAGASGQEQQVEKMAANLRQRRIRMQRDSAPSGDVALIRKRSERHVDAGAAQEIDRGDGLDFLKSFGKEGKNGRHGLMAEKH